MLLVLLLTLPAWSQTRTWITNVTIVSPENLNHLDRGNVLIENGRIVQVDRTGRASKPAGATVVSGNGQYLVPGLIDSHVHLASIPGMNDVQPNQQPVAQAYFKQLPRSYLYYGYTTLVDLNVANPQILDDFRHSPVHPDLYDCGASLPIANGYPMNFAPPATRFNPWPNFLYDPAQAANIPSQYKPEDHTPEAAVARVKASGGICVKTYFERGFGQTRNLPVITPELLARVRTAATRNGLVLMMHANGFEPQKFAEEGNVDVIAHGMWNGHNFSAEVRQVLDQIAEKKIGYQPTIQVLYGEVAYFDSAYLKRPEIAKVVPKPLAQWYLTPEAQAFKEGIGDPGMTNAQVIAAFEQGPLHAVRQVVAYLAGKDANFLFGTDTPSAPTYGNLPGLNGYLEMQQLQKAGMSLQQIFQAATINNAREFKLDQQLGTIEPGKTANLLLLKKSPLTSIDAYDSIATIWVHGTETKRDRLTASSN